MSSLKCSWGVPKLQGSHLVFFWPRGNLLEIEGQYHVRPSPWYLFNLRWVYHKLYGEIRVSETFMSFEGLLKFVLIFHFHVGQACILLTRSSRFAENISNLQLSASILEALCASILVPLCASIFVPLCIGWSSITFQVFHRGFPSYGGLICFSSGLGGAIFLKLKGNIMSDPPPDIFSTCCECLINFMGGLGSLHLCVSWGTFRFCATICFFFLRSSLHTLDKIIKICKEHI